MRGHVVNVASIQAGPARAGAYSASMAIVALTTAAKKLRRWHNRELRDARAAETSMAKS